MPRTPIPAAVAASLALVAPAGAAPLRELGPSGEPQPRSTPKPGTNVKSAHIPINRRFATLDAYLAYLEKTSALDNAWYRQIRPGLYRLETTTLRGPYKGQRVFTRQQLLTKFGFQR